MTGISCGGRSRPGLTVTRDQMAVFLARAMAPLDQRPDLPGYVPPAGAPHFVDVPAEHWAYQHVEYLLQSGVTTGVDATHYCPEWACTRDQMAVFVARAFLGL